MTALSRTPSQSFTLIVNHVLKSEGGYVDHPNDPGGETHFGISKRSYPDLDIRALTRAEAIEIYKRDYWCAYQCEALPPPVAAFVFDALVQHRPKTATTMLQHALGVRADGHIGPRTLAAAHGADLAKLLPELVAQRTDLYAALASQPSRAMFKTGWFRRLAHLQHFIYTRLYTELPR